MMHYHSRRSFIRNSLLTSAGLTLNKYSFALQYTDYTFLSIAEVSELVKQKKVSPVELVNSCLKRIELLNPKINAFITITAESALKEAKMAEKEIADGKWKGPLHGIPIAYKDNIDTAGVKTTAASGVYKDRIPAEDADVVLKLKSAGAISLGKLNMHEFALGTTSAISYFGAVHNPWNIDYIAGGSSGGSAAAVAAGMCYASIGTDTGGSSRLPPSCCGVTGMKATYGLISIDGIIPAIKSFDHACPITRTTEDIAILLNVLAGEDSGPFTWNIDYRQSFSSIKNPRVGIIESYKASDEIKKSFKESIKVLESLGMSITTVSVPPEPQSDAITHAELESYHGPLKSKFKNLYDPFTINDISQLKKISVLDYIIEKNKMELDRKTISEKLFRDADVLISPTNAMETPTISEAMESGPFALDPFNTEPFNYYGIPAISIPCGFSKSGLPLGLQIIGPRWGESKVLDIAHRYEQATQWHTKHPDLKG